MNTIEDEQIIQVAVVEPPENNAKYDARYVEGDKILSFCLSGGHTGTIIKVCDKVSDNGKPIYAVMDENGEVHEIYEDLLDDENSLAQSLQEISPKTDTKSPIDDSYIEKIRQENEEEMMRVITSLDLKPSGEPFDQLRSCCKLQAYMAEKNGYNDSVMDEKEEYPIEFITDIDLHNALIQKNGVCTSNALMFQSILNRLGVSVECVGLTSNLGGFHMANIVFLNGEWYYFDTTLEGTIRRENLDKGLVLCCAGLGSEEYSKYYNPQCVVRKNGTCELPGNISEANIPFTVVNSFISEEAYSEKSM